MYYALALMQWTAPERRVALPNRHWHTSGCFERVAIMELQLRSYFRVKYEAESLQGTRWRSPHYLEVELPH